jgi:signal transduction histidine kinase
MLRVPFKKHLRAAAPWLTTSQSVLRGESFLAVGLAMAVMCLLSSAAMLRFNMQGAVQPPYAIVGASAMLGSTLIVGYLRALRHRRRAVATRIDELEIFAARVAHDVRSPLTSATLALRCAAAGVASDDRVRGLILRAERSLHNIEQLAQDLLAFAMAGARPEEGASASVADTLENVVAEHVGSADANEVDLALQLEDWNDDMRAACSPGVLASIVGNLLGNAIKYVVDSSQRCVEVRAARAESYVRIEVMDSGPGLPLGYESRMFEPFVRGNTVRAGSGLGLATVKRLVTAHGGRISYRRREPRGSTFSVDLPLVDRDGHS